MLAADDAITLEPDVERTVALAPWSDAAPSSGGCLTALNMHGRAPIESHEPVAPPARPQAEAPEPTGAGPAT
jgi:hypothetical protein